MAREVDSRTYSSRNSNKMILLEDFRQRLTNENSTGGFHSFFDISKDGHAFRIWPIVPAWYRESDLKNVQD